MSESLPRLSFLVKVKRISSQPFKGRHHHTHPPPISTLSLGLFPGSSSHELTRCSNRRPLPAPGSATGAAAVGFTADTEMKRAWAQPHQKTSEPLTEHTPVLSHRTATQSPRHSEVHWHHSHLTHEQSAQSSQVTSQKSQSCE